MFIFLIRFVLAGLVVAAIPEGARLFGSRVAGYLPRIPVLGILGLLALHQPEGMAAVRGAAAGMLPARIPYAMFCVSVMLFAGRGWSLAPTVSRSVAVWAVGVSAVHLFTR